MKLATKVSIFARNNIWLGKITFVKKKFAEILFSDKILKILRFTEQRNKNIYISDKVLWIMFSMNYLKL